MRRPFRCFKHTPMITDTSQEESNLPPRQHVTVSPCHPNRAFAGITLPGWRTWLASGLLFLLALLPRLVWLGGQSLWLDEGSTWHMIQQSWTVLWRDMLSPVAAYPLYHLGLKAWVGLAGDSEWALRLPSALVGAGAVVALFLAAIEIRQTTAGVSGSARADQRGRFFPVAAALLLLGSPFALWYAQEAKVYSLLLLTATLLLWSLLRAQRLGTRTAWVLCGGIGLSSVFVHRLAVLLLIAAGMALLVSRVRSGVQRSTIGAWLLVGAASVGVVLAMVWGLGSERAETGAYIAANPLYALWLTFVRFSVDRWPAEFPWWWLLPWVLLSAWGGLLLARHALRGVVGARVLACFLLVPLGLFLLQLTFTRLYEPRYLILIYPAWILLLAYPLLGNRNAVQGRSTFAASGCPGQARRPAPTAKTLPVKGAWDGHWLFAVLLIAGLAVNGAVLTQPEQGLFSGDAVKEQYRDAVATLAARVHPDDLVVLHPQYVRPLYDYYMQRLTADPPPEPVSFDAFKQGQTEFSMRDWDDQRKQGFAGHVRSFLLIAPDHARTVDVPQPGDEYGLLGLYFQYSREQQKWPCGIWRFNGVHLLCQDSPEAYETGDIVRPATDLDVEFGDTLQLTGYTLKATTSAGSGVYRAGGTLPVTLFWDVTQQPDEDYHMFLHLCRECDLPPVAGQDGPPLEGYLPTRVWLPHKPVHDERTLVLPPDLAPGRYTLLLGVYRPGDPTPTARLPVQGGAYLEYNRLVLATITVEGQSQ